MSDDLCNDWGCDLVCMGRLSGRKRKTGTMITILAGNINLEINCYEAVLCVVYDIYIQITHILEKNTIRKTKVCTSII